MGCFRDVLKKTSPLDVFGDVSEKVKHLTKDVFNDVSPPALPLTPIRATWSFFSDVKIQDLKVTLQKCGEGREIC